MTTLAIDTATAACSIALGRDGEVVDEVCFAAGRSHLEMLLPAIDRLLAVNGVVKTGLRAIVVGVGPGTFSGLRVGVATARALAQGLGTVLTGSNSLYALAAGLAAAGGAGKLLPVIDARRGEVFSQLFGIDEAGKPVPQSEIICLNPRDLQVFITGQTGEPVLAAGDGVQAYHEIFASGGVLDMPGIDDPRHQIRARYHLPAEDSPAAASLEAITGVVPVYGREPDADKTVLLRKREPWLE